MAIFKVLLSDKGKVIGSMQSQGGSSGEGGPASATIVARPGQRIVDVRADDEILALDPGALHTALERKAKASLGKSRPKAKAVTRRKQGRRTS